MILPTYDNISNAYDKANKMYDFYAGKARRARKFEYFEKYAELRANEYAKCQRLLYLRIRKHSSIHSEKFGQRTDFEKQSAIWVAETKTLQKAKRQRDFESKIRVVLWFMQARFCADYGEFNCDNCSRVFEHSPATIMRGKEKLYNCVCGYCANGISGEYIYN
ncbi:hypothetical protein SAMN05421780_11420 [Flexibacter flexilis DSM 6793]|uniref:Uncharacterized protein n=1 Tax=Flexibacter flexilis DSM 6793 TaxID=927664 RepID=A0A1I1NCL3_9BACT|nr:hypothetical protein [Flexibacter flexilis]SFC95441.1 hypothetical protein SAMN05421780_11420 [Flexibacter flexilis DSM 6793]